MPARIRLCLSLLVVALAPPLGWADSVDELLRDARTALRDGRPRDALERADKAVRADPHNAAAFFLRGASYEMLGQHADAVADFTKAIELDPKAADAYDHRGSEQFKLGRVAESLADFDRFLELRPRAKPGHWKRGISLYYLGKFAEGAKQFTSYKQVDANDVENAVWHYLCTARAAGVEQAQAQLLKIGNDPRVPMMQVYDLFAGKGKPEAVLAAVRKGAPDRDELRQRQFYAHLYLALYYETLGDRDKTLEHLTEAEKHKIGHYMWDVARVHRNRLLGPGGK